MNKQEKQLLKEQKELVRLKAAQSKPGIKGYFVILMALILLFQLPDMMATGIWNNLQEVIVRDFAGLDPNADITAVGNAASLIVIALKTKETAGRSFEDIENEFNA